MNKCLLGIIFIWPCLFFSNICYAFTKHYPLIIIGSGPAGCMAAIYADQANIKTAMISGTQLGGPMYYSNEVYLTNWPGATPGISGKQLMEQMLQQVKHTSTTVINDSIIKADLKKHPFLLTGTKDTYTADAIIIATGTSIINTANKQLFIGSNIHSCSMCNSYLYHDKTVAVIGNGEKTIDSALFLKKAHVNPIIINPFNSFDVRSNILTNKNIEIMQNTIIKQIIRNANGEVINIVVLNKSTEKERILAVSGLFLEEQPNSDLFIGQLDTTYNFIKTRITNTQAATATSIPGVFAAGSVTDHFYGQEEVFAVATGAMAAIDAKQYLNLKNKEKAL